MKKAAVILLLCCSLLVRGQVCIQFDEPDRSRLPLISRTVSIDRVEGTHITAYANPEELAALAALGYNYTTTVPAEAPKSLLMATSVDQMREWNRYPTYETYLAMMQQLADSFPTLCRIDTIGRSVQNRLILCAVLNNCESLDDTYKPQFFYSSTMHGDEVCGYYLMLRLIDTLLHGYGTNAEYTRLLNTTQIYINPLSNPDGTYIGGNDNIGDAQRYNANDIDLNRNYPDPFGTAPLYPEQVENTAMINYLGAHNFRLSANLHSGAEVLNYPWDSFTSQERSHPQARWWQEVCQRFIDTSRAVDNTHFRSENRKGYICGGDWYVISNGRQDYVNVVHNCLEMTMEVAVRKLLSSEQLDVYWQFLQRPLVNYIKEIHHLPSGEAVSAVTASASFTAYPNPTGGRVCLENVAPDVAIQVCDGFGRTVLSTTAADGAVDLSSLPQGFYLLRVEGKILKIVRR